MEVAAYVELCTRLSRFVQLQPTDGSVKELQEVLDDLVAFYDRVETHHEAPTLVGLAAMDDLVLISTHRLLGGFARKCSSVKLQEKIFTVFARVLKRCKTRMRSRSQGHVHRQLGLLQSCVLFLPQPPEAGDDDTAESVTLVAQPEELRIAILKCLRELLDADGVEGTPLQLQEEQLHFFAYLVASLLHIAQRDRCREAALEAVETLKGVMVFIGDAQTLRQYLPGVSAGLWKCANAPQQTSKVIVAALECLGVGLRLCVGDDLLQEEPRDQEKQRYSLDAIRQSTGSGTLKELDAVDNADPPSDADRWLDATAVNIDLLLSRMFAADGTAVAAGTGTGLPRSSWRVRCALANLCGIVMLQCRRVLRLSFFRCYDELLVLRVDPIEDVSQQANRILQKLQVSVLSVEERLRLLPEMADRFQMLLSTLVLKVGTEHETTTVHLVRTLRGYVASLGSSLTPYFDAAIESIFNSLCRVVSFAALDIELVVHQSLSSVELPDKASDIGSSKVMVPQFQKRLRYFNDEASVRDVFALLQDIGRVLTPAGFIDCAFTLLTDSDSSTTESGHAEAVLVLNEFLRAYCPKAPDSENVTSEVNGMVNVHLVGRVLEDLLALKAWEEQSLPATLTTKRSIVSQRALMVECVGICAEILGKEFQAFLLYVLYPLVEQLGSHNVEIERTSLAALEKVYFVTGYESLEALFEANMDYFVDALCARLEQLDAYPMTAFVVEALLRHTRLSSLPLVDEVASSLLRSVDLYQDSPFVEGLLRALKNLLGSISLDVQQNGAYKADRMKEETAPNSLLANFITEIKMLENDGVDALDEDTDEADTTPPSDVKGKDELPNVKGAMPLEYDESRPDQDGDDDENDSSSSSGYRSLVIDILDRCGYFLADSDPMTCCSVLSLIEEGVHFLSNHQKQLLPLIARMWPEILPRLRADNRAIVTATVHVIKTIADIAGDFVGDRFVETVWPVLRKQLRAIDAGATSKPTQLTRDMLLLSKESEDIGADGHETGDLAAVSGARKSLEIRQLLAILSCLTVVCRRSHSVTQLVPEITEICCKYLSHTTPREVVEQTSELFGALVELNGDEVFCTVAALAQWVPPARPSARFASYEADSVRRFYRGHLSGSRAQSLYCQDNAAILLRRLFY